jgi:hypothetical protein
MASQWPPIRGVAYHLRVPIYGPFDTPQTAVAGLDSRISKDSGAFVSCTNELTELGNSGIYELVLTAAEMTADRIDLRMNTTIMGSLTASIDTIALEDVTTIPIFGDGVAYAG